MLVTCCITPPLGLCSRITSIPALVTLINPKKFTSICLRNCVSDRDSNSPLRP